MGLKSMSFLDPVDGVKFDFMAPLSARFQLGCSWVFSNTKTNKFELNSALSSMTGNNPMASQDEISFVSTRSDSTGKLEFSGQLNLGGGFSIRPEGFFMDSDIQKAHVGLEFVKEFSDSHIAYKFGGGQHAFSMMQTISPNIMGGFEMFYIVSGRISFELFRCIYTILCFIASNQRSAFLLRSDPQSRYPSVLRPIHAYCQKRDHDHRLHWKSKHITFPSTHTNT